MKTGHRKYTEYISTSPLLPSRYSACEGTVREPDSHVALLRGAVSEGNLLIKGSINKFKTKIEDKVRNVGGKICKECFMNSIQQQLNRYVPFLKVVSQVAPRYFL